MFRFPNEAFCFPSPGIETLGKKNRKLHRKKQNLMKISTKFRDDDPVLAKKPDPGICTSNEGRFLKVFNANILDNF